jgi:hypothetical protein
VSRCAEASHCLFATKFIPSLTLHAYHCGRDQVNWQGHSGGVDSPFHPGVSLKHDADLAVRWAGRDRGQGSADKVADMRAAFCVAEGEFCCGAIVISGDVFVAELGVEISDDQLE